MARFSTVTGLFKHALCLALALGVAGWASGQDTGDEAQPFSIEQIVGSADKTPGVPLSDEELLKILRLYAGSWRGSIDLTDKFGTVLQTLPLESEYRMESINGREVLKGRFQFGRDTNAKYSSTETEVSNGFLINRINQEGKNTVYRGEVEDGRIAWREYGVPRTDYNVFYESFDERNGRRILSTQSRNLMRDKDGQEKTYFTAGRSIYVGPLTAWTLPAVSFKEAASPAIPPAAPAEAAGAVPATPASETTGTTGGTAANLPSAALPTLGELNRKRAAGSELPADLKVAQAEIASLQDQLAAEQAASAKLRARIADLEAQITALTGQAPAPSAPASAEAAPAADSTAAPADSTDATGDDNSRTPFRTRSR
ncbi:MAG: hypothetical protein Q7Q73_09735 [Verrucomicrobiota bacterium JB024]|nr:hypothetical protein [Verrucomicrobiota bacterium JB024]